MSGHSLKNEATPKYRVEVDSGGCEKCSHARTWTVVGPDDFALSTSWEDEEIADSIAQWMNEAWELGWKSGPHAALAVLRDLEWIGMNDGRGVTQVMCPACSALKSRGSGHNPYCGLAAALASCAAPSPAGAQEPKCEGECNPYEAKCGARFCSHEAMVEHNRACLSSSLPPPSRANGKS